MKQKLYNKYVEDIAHYLKQAKNNKISKGINNNLNEKLLSAPSMYWVDNIKNESLFRSLSGLSDITGKTVKYKEKLGAHPSFHNLKNSDKYEYHYIVSMFIDVKNSTGLFKKYDPLIVANICRTIQLAAIHTCWHFDGYIQRLQGDGLMVYFGGKDISKQKAIENALLAASFISYFVKNDLKDLFEEQGVNRIYTRIGIDFGDDDATLWHNAGIGECSEVTTTSLHTSLACKMQAQADSNGIVVGGNIVKYKQNESQYFIHRMYKKKNDSESHYIYEISEENFRYKQFTFLWEKYLKKHPLIEEDSIGNLTYKGSPILPNNQIRNNIQYLQQNASDYKPYCK